MVLVNGITVIDGTYDQDIIEAGDGINFISGDASWGILDLIKTEATSEKIYNRYKNDSLEDDDIKGGNGINIIHAGPNNDRITGGAGINLMQFKVGDGDDTVFNGAGTDYLYFCDCSPEETRLSRKGDDLVIEYGRMKEGSDLVVDYNGSVTVKDYFKTGAKPSLKGIGFGAELSQFRIDLTEIENILKNEDITLETLGSAITNAFKNSATVSELINLQSPENSFKIEMTTPGNVTGTGGNDDIKGSTGSDIINGGTGDDIITGGAGDDKLYGGSGTNTFIFNEGDGKDTIYYQNGTDILDLTSVQNSANITSYKEKNDLIIKYGKADEIRLADYFKNKGKADIKLKIKETGADGSLQEVIKNLKDFIYIETDFSNETKGKTIVGSIINDRIIGTTKNDVIKGGDGNDIIYGNLGNDRLYGEGGKNTFVFNKGDGQDTVYSGKGEDTIKFEGIEGIETNGVKNVKFSAKGNNLIINYGNSDTVTVVNYLANPAKSSVKFIQFENGAPELISDLLNKYPFEFDGVSNKRNSIKGTNSKDIITGGNLNDTLNALNGDDIVYAGTGNDLVRGGNGNDTIYGEDGNDRLYGDNGDDVIYGGAGSDIIYGGNGNDEIYGGEGDDKLYGVSGNNTFYFSKGDGKDIVYTGKGSDALNFQDLGFSDLTYSLGKSNALTINYGNGDSVDIAAYFSKRGKVSVKKIATKDGEKTLDEIANNKDFKVLIDGVLGKRNTLRGTYKNDVITGGNLNDTIVALGGDDVISAGDGADVVRGGEGNDLIFGEGGNDKLYGDNGNDTIYGGTGDDIIYGGNGDDIIFGEGGNDKLYGDAGNNTFYFKEGDGKDTIYMNAKGSDTLVFNTNLKDTLTFDKTGNNLVINYGTKGDNVTIVNYLKSKNPSAKNIVFADYNTPKGNFSKTEGILLSDILIKKEAVKFQLNTGKSVNGEYYKGNAYNNLIISTGAYSEIDAGAGDDILYLQSKNVTAFGGTGNDKYVVSSLANNTTIKDTEGNNTVKILDKKTNVKVLFDVKISNGEIVNSADDSDSLLILNNAAFNKVKSTGKLNTAAGIKIDDFSSAEGISGNTPVQKIETNNGYLDVSALESIRQDVAGWLGNNGYTSAMDVLEGGNKADIQSLLAIYQTTDTKWV